MSSTIQYIPVNIIESALKVQLKDIESFIRLSQLMKIDLIFVDYKVKDAEFEQTDTISEDLFHRTKQLANTFTKSNKAKSQLSFIKENVLYWVDAKGFETIEAFEAAKLIGFSDGEDYKTAKELHFEDAVSYLSFKENGFSSKETFEDAKAKGFSGAHQSLIQLTNILNDEAKQSIKGLENDAAIYKLATSKNYSTFENYVEAVKLGFAQNDAADYKLAIEKGFSSAKQYYSASNKGFETAEESEEAKALKLYNKFELDLFKELNRTRDSYNFTFHDQAHIHKILNDIALNTSLNLKEINDIFISEQDKLKFQSSTNIGKGAEWLSNSLNKLLKQNSLPEWYKIGFKTKEEIKTFLISNPSIAKIGKFDISDEIFTKKIIE